MLRYCTRDSASKSLNDVELQGTAYAFVAESERAYMVEVIDTRTRDVDVAFDCGLGSRLMVWYGQKTYRRCRISQLRYASRCKMGLDTGKDTTPSD